MKRWVLFLVCALLTLTFLASASFLNPSSALAGPGILQLDVSLQSEPSDDAFSLSWLPAGTEVYVTGGAAAGFYPVTVGVLTGWIRADALVLEEQTPQETVPPGAATPVASVGMPAQAPIEEVAPMPLLDPNAPTVAVHDPGPVGPAEVTTDAPILAGPGPDYGVLGTAAGGALVEQTGHAVGGYVTVRYVGVTGWVLLDHLGPPS